METGIETATAITAAKTQTEKKRVARIFWTVVFMHAALWIILPCLLHSCWRIGDVIEHEIAAKEWVLSTRKHPMLQAWHLEIVNILTGRSFAAPFICSQMCILLAAWSVWQFGRTVLSEKAALSGAFIFLPSYFGTYHSLVYNQNLHLIALYAFTTYLGWQSYCTGKRRYWIAAGIAVGAGMNAKYPMLFIALAVAAFLLSHQDGRKHWKTAGPYLTALIAMILFLPQMIWIYAHDFAPLHYAAASHAGSSFYTRFYFPLQFLLHQSQFWIPTLIMLFPVIGAAWQWRKMQNTEIDGASKSGGEKVPAANTSVMPCPLMLARGKQYLLYCMLVPCGIFLVCSVLGNRHLTGAYGSCLWSFLGVWMLLMFRPKNGFTLRSVIGYVLLIEAVMVLFCFGQTFNHNYQSKMLPMRELGAACEKIWHSQYSEPCRYIGGEGDIAGYAAWAMPERPSVLLYGNLDDHHAPPVGTWADDSDLNEHGGLIVWNIDLRGENPAFVKHRYPKAVRQKDTLILPYHTWTPVPPLRIGVAVIPPKQSSYQKP